MKDIEWLINNPDKLIKYVEIGMIKVNSKEYINEYRENEKKINLFNISKSCINQGIIKAKMKEQNTSDIEGENKIVSIIPNITDKILGYVFDSKFVLNIEHGIVGDRQEYLKNSLIKANLFWEIDFETNLKKQTFELIAWNKHLQNEKWATKLDNLDDKIKILNNELQNNLKKTLKEVKFKVNDFKKSNIEHGIDALEYFKTEINFITLNDSEPSTSKYKTLPF